MRIPLSIRLLVDLKVDRIRYDVDGSVRLALTARAVEPLQLHIDVTPPRPADVTVGVASRNLRGEIIRLVAQVDDEIKRFIARDVPPGSRIRRSPAPGSSTSRPSSAGPSSPCETESM